MKTKDLALLILLFVGLKAFAQSTTIGNVTYEVLSPEEKTACCKAANTSISSASIASTVEIDGENYTVTMVKGRGFFNCKKLQSVSMPKTIEVIGDTAFTQCRALTAVDVYGKQIGSYAFRLCDNLTYLNFINAEEFKYCAILLCAKLQYINLPNTLTTIGEHFLCQCPSVKTLIIPASVTTIAGAFLHGCENLRSVYLFGEPSSLKETTLENDYDMSFAPIHGYKHVNNCTFYVNDYDTYLRYINNENEDGVRMWWRLDRDNTEYNQAGSDHSPFVDLTYFKDHTEDFPYNADDPVNGGYQNRYVYELDDKRMLEAGKWATICTPFNIDDYETVFGEGTKVAVLVKSEHEEMGVRDDMYHLTFHVIDARQMQADTPYLIKPGKNTVVTMYDNTTTDHAMTPEHWTREVKTSVFDTNEPSTEIFMVGKFLRYNLSKAEFYIKNFKNEDDEWQMGFYKAKTDGGSSISPFKCYFRIEKEGVAITEAKMGSMLMEEEDHGVTEITAVSLHENHPAPIYTLDGRRMNGTSAETLPSGIYIMNGKKWLKK